MARSPVWRWVSSPLSDLLPIPLVAAGGWLWCATAKGAHDFDWRAILAEQATLMGILAAVVTFASAALYGSPSKNLRNLRRRYGDEIRVAWIAAIATTIAAAFACHIGMFFVEAGDTPVAAALSWASLVAAALATLRALVWLNLVLREQDKEGAIVSAEDLHPGAKSRS